jgi:DNA-binding transcriptional ArsR family regulator
MPTKRQREQVARNRAKAMSHQSRAEALRVLNERTASPKEISQEIGESVGYVGYHVRQLLALGCIEKVGDRRVRGAVETFYRAVELPIVDTEEWEEIPAQRRAGLVGEFLQPTIDDTVRSVNAGVLGSTKDFHMTSSPLITDEIGLREMLEIHEETRLRLCEVAAESARRKAEGSGEREIRVSSFQACFEVPPP